MREEYRPETRSEKPSNEARSTNSRIAGAVRQARLCASVGFYFFRLRLHHRMPQITLLGVRRLQAPRSTAAFSAPPAGRSAASQRLMDLAATCGAELGLPIRFPPARRCDGNRVASVGTPASIPSAPRGGEIHSPA